MNKDLTEISLSELVIRYKEIRKIIFKLQNEDLLKYVSKKALEICGKKLRVMQNNTFVLDDMDQIGVVMDYCIYDYRQEGLNAVGRYIADSQLDPDSEEYTVVRAMSESFYTLVQVRDVLPEVGVWVNDLLAEREYLLIDMGFSQTALKGLPGDVELLKRVGFAHRRLGNWNEVLTTLERVVTLDPRDLDALRDMGGNTMGYLRRYPEAIDFYRRAYELAPADFQAEAQRAWMWVLWQGRLDSLDAALARLPERADLGPFGTADQWQALRLYWARQPDSLLAFLERSPRDAFEAQEEYLPTALYAGWAHQLRGNQAAARAAFESARAHLGSRLALYPDDQRVHTSLGLALAGLGRTQEAAAEARWIEEHPEFSLPFDALSSYASYAPIFALAGDAGGAVAALERTLAGPSLSVSAHTVRLDPRYDPIRNDPRFQALLAKYAEPKPVW